MGWAVGALVGIFVAVGVTVTVAVPVAVGVEVFALTVNTALVAEPVTWIGFPEVTPTPVREPEAGTWAS